MKKDSYEDNFHFLSQSSLLSLTKGWERVKNFDPLFSSPFSPPPPCSFPSPPSSSDPSLLSIELLRGHPQRKKTRVGQALALYLQCIAMGARWAAQCAEAHMETCLGVGPGVEETSFLGKENWLNMMVVARMILSNLMLAGWDHMGKENWLHQPLSRHLLLSNTALHNPTPRTGTKNELVLAVHSGVGIQMCNSYTIQVARCCRWKAGLPLTALLLTFARHSAAHLLTKPSSSLLSQRHWDLGSSQLLLANGLESLGKQTPRRWWNDENAFPDFWASLLPPVPALTLFLSFSSSFLFLKPSRSVQRSLTLKHFMEDFLVTSDCIRDDLMSESFRITRPPQLPGVVLHHLRLLALLQDGILGILR